MTQRRVLFCDRLRPTFTELEKRAAHIRLLTGIQSVSALCALLLRAKPTPARPAAAAASSPDSLRKYLLSQLRQESCRKADESWIRVAEMRQISTFNELRVIARLACWPTCTKVRTLKAPVLMVVLGVTRGDNGASVEASDTSGTGEVLPCVVWEMEVEKKEQEDRGVWMGLLWRG